jgi:hypothetical protein
MRLLCSTRCGISGDRFSGDGRNFGLKVGVIVLFQSSWFRSQPHRRKTLKFDPCTNSPAGLKA